MDQCCSSMFLLFLYLFLSFFFTLLYQCCSPIFLLFHYLFFYLVIFPYPKEISSLLVMTDSSTQFFLTYCYSYPGTNDSYLLPRFYAAVYKSIDCAFIHAFFQFLDIIEVIYRYELFSISSFCQIACKFSNIGYRVL